MKLLNYTSLLYLAPLAEAWRIQHTLVMRYGMAALVVMSQVNHSTYHPVARGVDIAVAHYMVLYALWCAAVCEVGEGWTECVAFEPETRYVVNYLDAFEIDHESGWFVYCPPKWPVCDVVQEIRSDAKIRVVIGDEEFDAEGLTIVPCLQPRTFTGLRVYLDPEIPKGAFFVSYRCYLFDRQNREKVCAAEEVCTGTHVYKDGLITRRAEMV
eukprot:jgi/Mesvir1/20222/Mv13460-RA.1